MSASNRKRQHSASGQVIQAKRRAQDDDQVRVRKCCNCANIFSTPHTLLSCTECDHTICIRCPVGYSLPPYPRLNPREIVYDEHNENLSPSLLPHAELGRRQHENMNKDGRNGDQEMRLSTLRRDQEHKTGHNPEDRHVPELQLQAQPQPAESQKQVEQGVSVKRNLNMNKCERCRLDKKKVGHLCILIATYVCNSWR